MSDRSAEDPLLFLDACCIINLYASGRIEDILRWLPYRFAVSRLVAETEVLSIRRAERPDGHRERELVSLAELEGSGVLTIVDLASESEQTAFARFAAELDDGEASVCALAVTRGGGVATDDRKALRVLAAASLEGPILQTPELLFDWTRGERLPEDLIADILRAVRDRGSYYPRRSAPHFLWWNSFFR